MLDFKVGVLYIVHQLPTC